MVEGGRSVGRQAGDGGVVYAMDVIGHLRVMASRPDGDRLRQLSVSEVPRRSARRPGLRDRADGSWT
jgi:hypothetical protein